MQTIYAESMITDAKSGYVDVPTGNIYVNLPIVPLSGVGINVILFDSFGKMKMIQDIAQEAITHFTKPDYIVCPEAKSIPLAQEMARMWNIDYFVLRKSKKIYMQEPKSIDTKSITSAQIQQLWYDENDVHVLRNKKIMLFDDVISTGGTIASLLAFKEACNLDVSSIASIYLEGNSEYIQSLVDMYTFEHLGFLPIITE